MKANVIDVRITLVFNYRYPITKSSNWIPVILQPRDRAPITLPLGTRRTNHDRVWNKIKEFGKKFPYIQI